MICTELADHGVFSATRAEFQLAALRCKHPAIFALMVGCVYGGGERTQVSAEDAAVVQQRRLVSSTVTSGDIPAALQAAEAAAPGVLSANPVLLFRMHVQAFVEFVSAHPMVALAHYLRCAFSQCQHCVKCCIRNFTL